MLRRIATIAASLVAFAVLGAGPALAHYCQNLSVEGDNAVGWALFSPDPSVDDPIDWDGLRLVGSGDRIRIVGAGFVDIYVDFNGDGDPDPEELVIDNMFLHTGLPLEFVFYYLFVQAV